MMKDIEFRKQAEELVSKMTIEEAASQLLYNSPAIERLDIPEYNWWNEALHGVARAGIATVFPQAIGMAATFDPDFLFEEAKVIAEEARAKYNMSREEGDRDIYKGLTYWSPNINIFRDPRWGRGHETYGEDPYLTGRMGNAFIEGLQQRDEKGYMKIAACAKHFAVHSGPEGIRHGFDAKPTKKDLEETYLPAFETAVEDAKAEAVMGAYNSVNGEPCNANKELLEKTLRGDWGFEGHVVSDCWAVRDFHECFHYTKTPAESAAAAIKAGCDLNCGCTYDYILDAYQEGLITEEDIRQAAVRIYTTRFRLGMFDKECSYNSIDFSASNTKENKELALEAAERSAVLLKNDGLLPLDRKNIKNIAVIGPNAYSSKALAGNYNGDSDEWVTNLDGIRRAAGDDIRIYYSQGSDILKDKEDDLAREGKYYGEARTCAKHSDVVILCLGLDRDLEGEEGDAGNSDASGDKMDLLLPPTQRRLAKEVLSVGKPTVIVLNSGSSLDLSEYERDASAIIQAWYSGQRGGDALADILFGKVSPSGKLPLTFYYEDGNLPDFADYHMAGRTYKFIKEKPWYPFGFGLSYTTFEYSSMKVKKDNDMITVSVDIENTGSFDARETTQVYIKYNGDAVEKPNHVLAGFANTFIKKGDTKTVTIVLDKKQFESVLEDGSRKLLDGEYTVFAGSTQPDERSYELTGKRPLEAELTAQQGVIS
ncbi:MAG: glycoside hydrolase family 3 C-terminal domain-containing protein [Lachnospiraceae bacterium]|nr:glycoside hydrolase family 3 C-terminal domain-containing protein [Lachnospiraceae bacterium]